MSKPFHARVCICSVSRAILAAVIVLSDLEKSNIPFIHLSGIRAATFIQGFSRIRGGCANDEIGKLPASRIRLPASIFHRSRLAVIKYLLTVAPASCFICQIVEHHGNCVVSVIPKACRGKPRCKSCCSKLPMRRVSHKL